MKFVRLSRPAVLVVCAGLTASSWLLAAEPATGGRVVKLKDAPVDQRGVVTAGNDAGVVYVDNGCPTDGCPTGGTGGCPHCHGAGCSKCGWIARKIRRTICPPVYPVHPGYRDPRDTMLYGAHGYGVPIAVPLAPVVKYQYNYGWGIPSSRLTRVDTQYTRWHPPGFATVGNPNLHAPAAPQMYWPTDTTQLGFYGVHAPHWVRTGYLPGMP